MAAAIDTTDLRGIIVDAGPPTSGATLRNPLLVDATTFYFDSVGAALYVNLPVAGVNTWLEVRPPMTQQNTTTSTPVTIAATTRTLRVANAATAVQVNLPALASFPNGDEILVKKIDTGVGVITVDADGTDTIDGAANYAMLGSFQSSILLRADVAAGVWRIVSTRNSNV